MINNFLHIIIKLILPVFSLGQKGLQADWLTRLTNIINLWIAIILNAISLKILLNIFGLSNKYSNIIFILIALKIMWFMLFKSKIITNYLLLHQLEIENNYKKRLLAELFALSLFVFISIGVTILFFIILR